MLWYEDMKQGHSIEYVYFIKSKKLTRKNNSEQPEVAYVRDRHLRQDIAGMLCRKPKHRKKALKYA
jgi:hypothetical protein